MNQDERIAAAHTAMQSALITMHAAFELLTDAIYESDRDDTEEDGQQAMTRDDVVDPAPKIASDDPTLCQHPHLLIVRDQRLCHDCGANLDE